MREPAVLYDHPGHAFVERVGVPAARGDLTPYVTEYAAFLRSESGATEVPVDLDRICSHFGIQWGSGAVPDGTEGWSDGESGRIHLRDDCAETRRRFTHAHELIELLVHALTESRISDEVWHRIQGRPKESLCNRGAAALLLPHGPFEESADASGVSVQAARRLADSYGTSLLATVIALVQRGPGSHALIGWRWGLRPTDEHRAHPSQMAFGAEFETAPLPKLRVAWVRSTVGTQTPYIPTHKSIEEDSVSVQCARGGGTTAAYEALDLGELQATCWIETIEGSEGVADALALVHLPEDTCGLPERCALPMGRQADSPRLIVPV